jgi:SNF2 family DNA or RNA helicase
MLIEKQQEISNAVSISPSLSTAEIEDSSFDFTPITNPSNENILDITKFIPAGCIRLERSTCNIWSDVWDSCNTWRAFAHPRDFYNRGCVYLSYALQELLMNSPALQSSRPLHYAGWIRMEFRRRNSQWGQVRVYVLPDDVARGTVDRDHHSLRKALQSLLNNIDVQKATWKGEWSEHSDVVHIDSSLDRKAKDEPSLFYLFNTLPSPKPDHSIITNKAANYAMRQILANDVEGLKADMYLYQCRSAAMMLQKEAQPAHIIDPRLRHMVDQRGITWYCDTDSGLCLREPRRYEAAKGGVLAETMGLGKTLICLALILATKDISSQIPVECSVGTIPVREKTGSLLDMVASTIGRHGIPWKSEFTRLEAEGYEFPACREALKKGVGYYYLHPPAPARATRNPTVTPPRKIFLTTATLVVCPSNLVQQWRAEIQKHTTGLKVLFGNSMKDPIPPAEELADYDIILFGKQRFEREARDGSDSKGRRRTTTSTQCNCPYIGATRDRDCTCFNEDEVYRSPLKDLHFKRIITDEGHTFGNSSNSSKTEAVTVLDFLRVESRWIVSGTPTRGLYGLETANDRSEVSSIANTPRQGDDSQGKLPASATELSELSELENSDLSDTSSELSEQDVLFYKQERTDLEKLGNIATQYLKARPWAHTDRAKDTASWNQLVMQPRHGAKSRGNMDCLKATLEGMIIRHRHEDVLLDVSLPPLTHTVVHLEGSMQNKLSLNTFCLMVITNAITSERKDADYFFHSRQRKALQSLVSNLRQASFFWSGFEAVHVRKTIDIAKLFLEERNVPVTPEDESLLLEAIKVGEMVLSNNISQAISTLHEMPMHIENEWSDDIRKAWSLDGQASNPTVMGATMVHAAQKFVDSQQSTEPPTDTLIAAGKTAMSAAIAAQDEPSRSRPSKKFGKDSKSSSKRAAESAPVLAGGVTVGDSSSPRKRPRVSSGPTLKIDRSSELKAPVDDDAPVIKDEEIAGIEGVEDESVSSPSKGKRRASDAGLGMSEGYIPEGSLEEKRRRIASVEFSGNEMFSTRAEDIVEDSASSMLDNLAEPAAELEDGIEDEFQNEEGFGEGFGVGGSSRSQRGQRFEKAMRLRKMYIEARERINNPEKNEEDDYENSFDNSIPREIGVAQRIRKKSKKVAAPKSKKAKPAPAVTLDPNSPLASASIISTASTKLSYLLDKIVIHHSTEKILVFYEADNVAYYIAQALECLRIQHLIYAKSLSSERKSQYIVTFNQSNVFRVLLMDVSQAAFGLDLSSASRVYFVNPVFSPQVEAQAVKRAHRIGQTKPVFVETLVLKGSIEEVILDRRSHMSNEEHNKCKNILDDQTMYDWIKNISFLDVKPEEVVDQMARLEMSQPVFGKGPRVGELDPDADLITPELYVAED